MHKIILTLIGIVLIIGAALAISRYEPTRRQPDQSGEVRSYRATLAGEYLCLPHIDTSGPQTMECAFGLKTDDGKYYALDFNLASQTPPDFSTGDRLEANGVITPVEMLSSDHWQKYPVVGIFSVTDSARKLNDEPIGHACNSDGKICPDGSVVGRTGSECQFTECPSPNATTATVRTTLGQVATGLNVSITPKQIMSDSRCPSDVQCVWAGTVEVKTVLATEVSHGEHVLTLGKPQTFGNYTVTLVEVSPERRQGQNIPGSSYRFVFEVSKI